MQFFGEGANYQVGFSPYGNSLAVVLAAIDSAKESIYMTCYEFTSRPIADALIVKYKAGVKVAVVADYKASLERYSLIPYLAKSGLPIRRCATFDICHDKSVCIDAQTVELGSYNFTSAATSRNHECLIVLYSVPYIAKIFLAEWQRLWDGSR
jgi:phosphatidylserine/phosphatidylglycerophosphate/cardiolipin synthase-like enzyme